VQSHRRRRSSLAGTPAALLGAVFSGIVAGGSALAQTVGLVADNQSKSVIVFDADAQSPLASMRVGSGAVGDCMATPDMTLGFVTDFQRRVWVIDLTASPPRLADGVNPIRITNPGEDLAISADGRYLVVSDGNQIVPLSVVDIEARTEVATYHTGSDNDAVDVGPDGSVVVTSLNQGTVRRLVLADDGSLSDTGESMRIVQPNNVHLAPGGMVGVAIGRQSGEVATFLTHGLEAVERRTIDGLGISAAFSPAGDRLYVRSTAPGELRAYAFDPMTAIIGDLLWIAPVDFAPAFFGMDQLAVHPDGDRLFVPEADAVAVLDAATGAAAGSIEHGDIRSPTGVFLPPGEFSLNEPPVIAFGEPFVLWPPRHDLFDVSSAVSVDDPDGDELVITATMYSDEPENADRVRPRRGRWRGRSNQGAADFVDEWSEGGRGLLVRRERLGRGDGRFYLLHIHAEDGQGGEAEAYGVVAVVPHSRWRRAVDHVLDDAFHAEAVLRAETEGPAPELHELGLAEEETQSEGNDHGRHRRRR